ncbi:MAG: hypothetical protein J2P26_13450 [Nocardiopsaceae bacterium]|nr:hypothetical protein [Nocardiopsaceae bacterium]
MLTALWWVADLLLLAGVAPVTLFLAIRIIRDLLRAHRALVAIYGSADALARGLPPALGEVVSAVRAVEGLVPAKIPASTR